MRKTVALIFGGEGYEREISKRSKDGLLSFIDKERFRIIEIEITKDGVWLLQNENGAHPTFPVCTPAGGGFLHNGELVGVDVAIPCLHGDFGEDGNIQGALTCAHIPYVGEDVYASALTSDKAYTKFVADALGIPTAGWLLFTEKDSEADAQASAESYIGYPMFLKSARLGSSFGAVPVLKKEDFSEAYREVRSFGTRLLCEEFIDIECEIECAFLSVGGTDRFSPDGEIRPHEIFYNYSEKYSTGTSAALSYGESEVKRLAKDYASRLARAIGIRSLSRIDFFLDKRGKLIFNEINSFPGMTETSLYPKLTERLGLARGEFINLLIEEKIRSDRRI